MTHLIVFVVGLVVGWRGPVFVSAYRRVRPSCGSRGRALAIAVIAALGIPIGVQ